MEKKVKVCPSCKATKKTNQRMVRYKKFVELIEKQNFELDVATLEVLEQIKVSEKALAPKVKILNF
jgi:hypothetical protein